jgi:hypothetical protein
MHGGGAAGGDAPEAVGEVHRRVEAELERLRLIGLEIEQSLCNAADGWSIDDQRVRDLQQLDSLLQHLAALRDFLGALSAPLCARVDLRAPLSRVPLEALRARLAGAALSRSDGAGGIELF